MIQIKQGNLLTADVEALVNTVNCVGVMGKGIALQFKQAFSENFKTYAKACKNGEVQLGRMFTFIAGTWTNPKYIINFPTKKHWRGRSKLKDIETGLHDLVEEVRRLGIKSIAIPPLGCGYGGLEWPKVRNAIETAFEKMPNVKILLFEPKGTPYADSMPVDSKAPSMTRARALFVKLLERYAIPGYRLSLLEVQKLAYFLQVAGEPLRLNYVKQKYGPYAENLNFVLQRIEGHYIRGYGDRSIKATIRLLPGASEKANQILSGVLDARERLSRVKKLIEGFETPYGMELLSSVHWVAMKEKISAQNIDMVTECVLSWSVHKKRVFKPTHIYKAWKRLSEQNWLQPFSP